MSGTFLERWIKVKEIRTHYLTSGNGEAVILLHGGGAGVSAIHNWQKSMGLLAEAGFSVFAPEIVGFGLTDKPSNANAVAAKVQHVKDFIDSLCLDRFHLVGNSMGGRISLEIASDWPDRVQRLVLMGSAGMRSKPTPELQLLFSYTPSRERMKQMVDAFCYDSSFVTEAMIESRYQMSLLPGAQEAYEALMKGIVSGQILIDEEKLTGIHAPALLVCGKQDRVVPLECGERMAKLLPKARLEVVDKCGHWVQIEHPDFFNQLVIRFLQSPPSTDSS